MIKLLMPILYNKRYSYRSLYGSGIFPYWLYIKYYGKPAYVFSRKRGLNVYFSLMVANIPGSMFHVSFFKDGTLSELLWFVISLVIFTSLFYGVHKYYVHQRN